MSGGSYMAVPNPGGEADLGADRPNSYMSDANLPPPEPGLLGPNAGVAPSIMSRDSTYSSFGAPPSITGSHGARSSWGSNHQFASGAAAPAGAEPGSYTPSGLGRYSSPFHEEGEEQGHFQPDAPVPQSDKEIPAWAGGAPKKKRKSRALLWGIIIALVLICIGVGLGVGLGLTKPWETKNSDNSADKSNDGLNNSDHSTDSGPTTDRPTTTATSSAAPSPTPTKPTWGGHGSTILLSDGTNMTYENNFGGYWVWDEANPLNNSARCNSWTPSLEEEWDYNVHVMRGVGLGGWLNTEPFITPALYEQTPSGPAGTSVDEYTLSINLGDKLETVMRNHYDTFITERDFAEIASAGLNYIRLAIPHWAIETYEGEPYLAKVSWEYVLKAFQWARKYGLRVNLDLHTAPGSQNGWNHSGRLGLTNVLNGTMGLANAQRTLEYIRTIAQFISQPQWAPVVPIFGFINEPNGGYMGKDAIAGFTLEVYDMIRNDITGFGKGNGPYLSMHNAFIGSPTWMDFARGADRLMLDQHPYLVFQDQLGTDPDTFKWLPCQTWADDTNHTSQTFGTNNAGEWSAAINDCGQWVNGVGLGTRYEGTYAGWEGKGIGNCSDWNDYRTWSPADKEAITQYVAGSMDALQNNFFWVWKIQNSTGPIAEINPLWNYQLGLREGWLPKDPRSVIGTCINQAGVSPNPFSTLSADWMTGGAQTYSVASQTFTWPPNALGTGDASTVIEANQFDRLPQFTQTGTPITLPGPTYTAPGAQKALDFGSGWANSKDNRRAYTPVAGCTYPDEYLGANVPVPGSGACGAGIVQPTRRQFIERDAAPIPAATPAP